MTLTKAALIDRIYNSTDLPKVTSTELVDALLEIIKRTLEKGEDIPISGFGNVVLRKGEARALRKKRPAR
jgi:integration host factor subunit alpha